MSKVGAGDKNLNILYFTRDAYPTFRMDIECLFGKYLPRFQIDATIVASATGSGSDAGQLKQITKQVNDIPRYLRPIAMSAWYAKVAVMAARQFDAIQARNLPVFSAFLAVFCRLMGKPFFYWMSFPYPEDDITRVREQGMSLGAARATMTFARGVVSKFIFYRLVVPCASHVFVQSDQMKLDVLKESGVLPNKITPVPMGVDLDEVNSWSESGGAEKKETLIGYFGAMDRTRELDFVLRMFVHVLRARPDSSLVFVGGCIEQKDCDWLISCAENLGIADRVSITGWLPRIQAWSVLMNISVGVCPLPDKFIFKSMSPTKIVELLALGIPVVTNEHPDQAALVRDGHGGLVVPYEEIAFADAVRFLLDNRLNARECGLAGRAYVAKHRSYLTLAEGVAEVYKAFYRPHDGDHHSHRL